MQYKNSTKQQFKWLIQISIACFFILLLPGCGISSDIPALKKNDSDAIEGTRRPLEVLFFSRFGGFAISRRAARPLP